MEAAKTRVETHRLNQFESGDDQGGGADGE